MKLLTKLRNSPSGLRVLCVVGMIIHIPCHLWLERRDIAYAYRIYWHGLKTGGNV